MNAVLQSPRATAVVVSMLGLLLSACSGSGGATDDRVEPEPRPQAGGAWPRSMVVLGHSGVNGEGMPGNPVHNSWATGSNPDVNSVYLRILERQPDIEGHVSKFALGGATVAEVGTQVDRALQLEPAPQLVVVQVVDNDMACPAAQTDYDQFEEALTALLRRLSEGLPRATVFVPAFYAEPASYITTLTKEQRRAVGGQGPCAIVNPDGSANRTELRRLERIVAGYDAAIMSACEATPRCVSDEGAFERTRLHPRAIGEDLGHLSIAGNAHAAATAWREMRTLGVLPKD